MLSRRQLFKTARFSATLPPTATVVTKSPACWLRVPSAAPSWSATAAQASGLQPAEDCLLLSPVEADGCDWPHYPLQDCCYGIASTTQVAFGFRSSSPFYLFARPPIQGSKELGMPTVSSSAFARSKRYYYETVIFEVGLWHCEDSDMVDVLLF